MDSISRHPVGLVNREHHQKLRKRMKRSKSSNFPYSLSLRLSQTDYFPQLKITDPSVCLFSLRIY